MEVSIVNMGGEDIAKMAVEADANGRKLKYAILADEGTPVLVQKLLYQDQPVKDDSSLLEQGIDGSHPVVLVRIPWEAVEDEAAEASIKQNGTKYSLQQHFFWAVHAGNWPACLGLLRRKPENSTDGVSVDSEMLPTDFDDTQADHAWPYMQFDGRYEDRALHLATRCRDTCTVAALLRCRADPNLKNDNGETPLDIALGKGEKWDHAFLQPHDFGGSLDHIINMLTGSTSAHEPDLLAPPTLHHTDRFCDDSGNSSNDLFDSECRSLDGET